MKKILISAIFICTCFLISACGPALVVNSSADDPDTNVGDGKCKTSNNECTLRAAIMEANASDDISEITFENVLVINPTSALPPLTAGNTRIIGDGQVTLNGNLITDPYPSGIEIKDSKNNIIQGLTIKNFWYGIEILAHNSPAQYNVIGMSSIGQGGGSQRNIISHNEVGVVIWGIDASDNIISGNYIGMRQDGVTPWPNETGIFISDDAHDNLIGSVSGYGVDQGGNLISGNAGPGIHISEGFQNHISGNYIGTKANGAAARSNLVGIRINNGSKNNIVGIRSSGEGSANLISGNTNHGIHIMDQDSSTNVIAGNLIGTNFDGSSPLGNGAAGILVSGDSSRIGTNGDGASDQLESNVISGNGTTGISLHSTGNQVSGNKIGVDSTGLVGIGNTYDGIFIDGYNNLVGTDGDGIADEDERNIISANATGLNGSAGVTIYGGNGNIVAGNFIGTDISGNNALGNLEDGISISNLAFNNLIGTDGDGIADNLEGNLISGNGRSGIVLDNCELNTIAGNLIGTNLNGTNALPNGSNNPSSLGSVHLGQGSSQNVIGTNGDGNNDSAEGNIISGNSQTGIKLTGPNTTSNVVAGNHVGVDITASAVLGNQRGIVLGVGADNNLIGTNADGMSDFVERNIIGGNAGEGISISGSSNQVSGNFIGTDTSGSADLGNGSPGISITDNTVNNTIGGSSQKANTIAFNKNAGVVVAGMNADNVLITYNSIHSNDRTGICLEPPAPTGPFYNPNDPGDLDSGPNDLMNYPELTYASTISTSVAISGEILDGLSNTQFEIQFFSNAACDTPSEHGEGKKYLGSSTQQTDGSGNVQFLVTLPALVPPGSVITATATSDSKTSEFSNCVEVVDAQVMMEKADEEEYPCDVFVAEDMRLTTFNVREESGQFIVYLKNPFPYPATEGEVEWEYSAALGDISAEKCDHQGFPDRLYCVFYVPKTYYNTRQTLRFSSSLCVQPFYVNEDVTIFSKGPAEPAEPGQPDEPGTCKSADQRDCIAAGGTWNADTCSCSIRY